jgi:hypothetical protein
VPYYSDASTSLPEAGPLLTCLKKVSVNLQEKSSNWFGGKSVPPAGKIHTIIDKIHTIIEVTIMQAEAVQTEATSRRRY